MSAIKNISLFVPHVFPNFSQKYVADAFSEIGDVDRVDFVPKQDRDGKDFNAVYIHFKRWYDNRLSVNTQDDIIENGSYKFYHGYSGYFWIVLPNTAKKHIPGERKPRIDLGDSKSVSVKAIEKTPVKKVRASVCPAAPKKPSYSQILREPVAPALSARTLLDDFEELPGPLHTLPVRESYINAEDISNMEEIEDELAREDENLVSIDYRYIQTIEHENLQLHGEIAQLRMALINLDQMYQAEKAKVTAFRNIETYCDL